MLVGSGEYEWGLVNLARIGKCTWVLVGLDLQCNPTDRLITGGAHVMVPEDVRHMIVILLIVLPHHHYSPVPTREQVFASSTQWAP